MMQDSSLDHIQYTQLDPMTWCATAQVSAPLPINNLNQSGKLSPSFISNRVNTHEIKLHNFKWYHQTSQTTLLSVREMAYKQRQQQRAGVRLLLQSLLNKLNVSDNLDDSSFPYRLNTSQYFVCFSHTAANSKSTNIKPNNEKYFDDKVAVIISRYRAVGIDIEVNDVAWYIAQRFYHRNEITILRTLPVIQRDNIVKLLWQIKESFIKIYQYKLAQGLGMDYSFLISELINGIKDDIPLVVITDSEANYHIALIPSQQIVIVY
ncbi:4'-phosphopantetheinyl transferase family protein [Psychrobacter sp. DAB_AL62B]|uniref:4'-phosphopantetheinyl transferase family protein n=1 Tax=Psychrobacter sp. DAB_AL62B TaxID=1028420 RepID=UPI002380E017|nr:4'-phosphopantetheinyl transferase superfamily protein [Psychrobacter sp. DAB_AL62B]MDE4454167.1 4-phosphopantetheinyl transferase family protein [Psychrobacter sp. DAB_AL62B]